MIRSPLTNPGPLAPDAEVVSGATIKLALGPETQAIPGATNNASIDTATFVNTDQLRFNGLKGLVYKVPLSAEDQAKADRYIGL